VSEQLNLTVTGMTCGGCENAVKRAVRQLEGVEDVSASHAANQVGVRFDDAKVNAAKIRERIEALGYTVTG
jgi:copper chaperone CopZ